MTLKKRFQVFISSTFADLRSERDEISNAILAAGHFPAGMELFGSDADDSWTVIERTIDLSDFFVLVSVRPEIDWNTDSASFELTS